MKRALSCLLLVCLLLAGCSAAPASKEELQANDLLRNVSREQIDLTDVERAYEGLMADLAVRMMQQTLLADPEGENILISPLSVLYALGMVSNGADDMEAVEAFWGNTDLLHINEYLYEYTGGLPQGEKAKLNLANSVWFKDVNSFSANESFLQTVKNYYDADVYKAPFDKTTLKDINDWVALETDGTIKEILKEIPSETLMYLINALVFEAEWAEPYTEDQQREGVFTKEDGEKQTTDFLYGCEYDYLEDELATGFIKYYDGNQYAFVALLPKEGVTAEEYVNSLTGEALLTLLNTPEFCLVHTIMPVFETEYDVEMKDLLKAMGYPTDGAFNGLGTCDEGSLAISNVFHKTYIKVDAKGTKAGAATAIDVAGSAAPGEIKKVNLDRPFVYMLIDCRKNTPFFIGIMDDVLK